MWKLRNIIAWWLIVISNIIPWYAVTNNQKINSQKNDTNKEIVDVFTKNQVNSTIYVNQNPEKYTWIYAGFESNPESLDWDKIYNISLSEIPPEVLKYGLLRKINEIRKENWLKPLKYDKKLEQVAQDYAEDLKWTQWWKPWHILHQDSKWRDEYDRVRAAGLLWSYIEKSDNSVRENMSTISWYTINSLFYDFMNSYFHKKAIISQYVNSIWFWYCRESNTIIQLFWQVKDN